MFSHVLETSLLEELRRAGDVCRHIPVAQARRSGWHLPPSAGNAHTPDWVWRTGWQIFLGENTPTVKKGINFAPASLISLLTTCRSCGKKKMLQEPGGKLSLDNTLYCGVVGGLKQLRELYYEPYRPFHLVFFFYRSTEEVIFFELVCSLHETK